MKLSYLIIGILLILITMAGFFFFKDSTILKSNLQNKKTSFSDKLVSWNGNTLDIIEPYPITQLYYTNNTSIPLTFTSSGDLDQCWYNIDGDTNYSTIPNIPIDTITLGSGLGYIHGTVYTEDYPNYLFASTRTNPANIIRFNNLSDLSDYDNNTIEYFENADSITYSNKTGLLYVSRGVLSTVWIKSIDPETLVSTTFIQDASRYAGPSPAILAVGDYLYISTYSSPTTVIKYNITSGAYVSNATLTGQNGHSLGYSDGFLYTSGAGGAYWVARINITDMSFEEANINSNDYTSTDDLAVNNDFFFVGSEHSGNITMINKTNLSDQTVINVGINSPCYGVYYNSNYSPYVWAVYDTSPGKLVRINYETLEYNTYTTPQIYPNEVLSDGERLLLTYWQSPSKATARNLYFNEWGDSCNYNTTFSTSEGSHTINLYANDTSNNLGKDSVIFGVDLDYSPTTIPPSIIFDESTTSGTISNNYIFVNVTSSDTGFRGNENISSFVNFDNSLIAWWRMDDVNTTGEKALIQDYFNNINGTAKGNAIQSSGKLGYGFSFDGNGDYINIGQNNALAGMPELTISAWVYPKKDVNTGTIVGAWGVTGGNTRYLLRTDSSGRLQGYIRTSSQAGGLFSDIDLSLNNWHHVVLIYNGSKILAYHNGVLSSTSYSLTGNIRNTQEDLWIGDDIGASGVAWNGSIDDVILFNRSLTANEIAGIYANQSTKYFDVNFTGLDYGTYDFTAYAQDTSGNINSTFRSVEYIEPSFSIELLNPTLTNNNYNITKNEGFWVDLNVTCIAGTCGTINISLDPIVYEDFTTWTETDSDNDLTVTNNLISATQITSIYYLTKSVNFNNDFIQRFELTLNSLGNTGEYFEPFWVEGNENGGIGLGTFDDGGSYHLWLYDYGNFELQSEDNSILLDYETKYYITIIQSSNIIYVYIRTGGYNGELIDVISISNSIGIDFISETLGYGTTEFGTNINFTIEKLEINPTIKSGLIPIQSDWTNLSAFYTNATSNPLTTNSLTQGQSQTIRFWVNATGNTDTYNFYAYGNLTSNPSISNKTANWNITILEIIYDTSFTVSLPIGYTNINFSSNSKTVSNLEPEGQNSTNGIIYLTNTGEETLDIYFKTNQLIDGFNIFFDIDNNPIGSKLLNSSNQLLKGSLTSSSSQNIWGWVNWTDKTPQTNSTQLNISVERN